MNGLTGSHQISELAVYHADNESRVSEGSCEMAGQGCSSLYVAVSDPDHMLRFVQRCLMFDVSYSTNLNCLCQQQSYLVVHRAYTGQCIQSLLAVHLC